VFILNEEKQNCLSVLSKRFMRVQKIDEEQALIQADVKYRN